MNRTRNWRPTYVHFTLLGVLLIVVGQWGAGVTTLALTVAVSQLVRIGNLLEVLTSSLDENDQRAGQDAQGRAVPRNV